MRIMRITLPILALLLATALVAPVVAAPGNGNGNGNGGGNSQGSENSGNQNAGAGNNNGNANGAGNGNANGNSGNKVVRVPKDEKVAREAVKNRQLLSLTAVTALLEKSTKGRVLDVELVQLGGVYLYEVTVLEPDGRLHKLYYNARSGALVTN